MSSYSLPRNTWCGLATQYSLLCAHYQRIHGAPMLPLADWSLVATRCWLLTAHCLPLSAHRSPLTERAHYSLFTVHCPCIFIPAEFGSLFNASHPPMRCLQALVDMALERSASALSNAVSISIWELRSGEWSAFESELECAAIITGSPYPCHGRHFF